MKKILLVFEGYNELVNTEIFLKRVGFDVVGINNEGKMADQLLVLNPDVVVAYGKGSRVSSLSVGQKLRDNHKYHGKAILIFAEGARPGPQDLLKVRMDAALDAPIEPIRMLQALAKLGNLDGNLLLEKFKKSVLSDPSSREKSQSKKSLIEDHERVRKYEKFLQDPPADIKATTFNKQEVKDRLANLKKDWNFDELEDIDKLKQQFADALFKKS